MPRQHRRVLGSRPYINWSREDLEKAINDVSSGSITLRAAQDKYKIPKSTIQRKMNNLHMGKVGRPTELNADEEDKLVQGLIILAEWGTPLTAFELRLLVKSYLDAKGQVSQRFKRNTPGEEWCYSFLKRHKTRLSSRLCSNIKRARAQVSKEDVTSYFSNLEYSTIGVDPECIINFDETNVSDDPGRKKMLARRGSKRVDRVMDHSKSSTSVMFSGTATGEMLPPYIVYKAEHLHSTWITNGPTGARYNRSRSGWFDGVLFENWFDTIILPYFEKINGEKGSSCMKVLIGDNLSSHISLSIIQKCEENNIRFVLFPPNATHLCQPLDVAVFRSFKSEWRKVLTEWKLKNKGTISKDVFPSILKKALQSLGDRMSTNLISGFRASGIYPHDPQAVLKRLPQHNETSSGELWSQAIVELLQKTRQKDASVKKRRSKLKVKPGESVSESHFQETTISTQSLAPSASGQRQGPSTSKQSQTINRQELEISDDDMLMDGRVEFVTFTQDIDRTSSISEDNDHEDGDPLYVGMINKGQNNQDIHSDDEENEDINSEGQENEDTINEENEDTPYADKINEYIRMRCQDNEDINNKNKENTTTENISYRRDDFVLIKLTYNTESKKPMEKFFVAQIKIVESYNFVCKFMRKGQKTEYTFVFPQIEDGMQIQESQIVRKLSPPDIRRGRHIFKDMSVYNFNLS